MARPRTYRYWTHAEQERAALLRRDNFTVKDIAAQLGRTSHSVKATLRKLGIQKPRRFGRITTLPQRRKLWARELAGGTL
jgi:hypothetical protein